MTNFEGIDLCWIKRNTADDTLYEILRCKLTDISSLIDIGQN